MIPLYFNGKTVKSLNPLNYPRSYRSSPTEEHEYQARWSKHYETDGKKGGFAGDISTEHVICVFPTIFPGFIYLCLRLT